MRLKGVPMLVTVRYHCIRSVFFIRYFPGYTWETGKAENSLESSRRLSATAHGMRGAGFSILTNGVEINKECATDHDRSEQETMVYSVHSNTAREYI